jgi:hypothetical protein
MVIFFLYSIKPYKNPERNALKVKPGKYGPFGNISIPKTSAIAAATPAVTGPNRIADIAIAINSKDILTVSVSTEVNLVKIISSEIKRPTNRIFLILSCMMHYLLLMCGYIEMPQI